MGKRNLLYNEILRTVKEHGKGMERGLVLAVLSEVEGTIASASSREPVDSVLEILTPRSKKG